MFKNFNSMRVTFFLIVFVLTGSLRLKAQESILKDLDNTILNKYINLAIQNYPRMSTYLAGEEKAKSLTTVSKLSFFDAISPMYFKRFGNQGTATGQVYYPDGVQLGIGMNLGSLFSKPALIKAANADYKSAKAQKQEYIITLTSEVKNRYYDLLLTKKQLELNNISFQNAKSVLADAKSKYQTGQITIDQYTIAKSAADQSEAGTLVAEVNYLKAKNALEDLIGVKLENVK